MEHPCFVEVAACVIARWTRWFVVQNIHREWGEGTVPTATAEGLAARGSDARGLSSQKTDELVLGIGVAIDIALREVSKDRYPACSWTSRRLQPARWGLRAAWVMKLRRPEWDEHPAKPRALYSATNQLTRLLGRIAMDNARRC